MSELFQVVHPHFNINMDLQLTFTCCTTSALSLKLQSNYVQVFKLIHIFQHLTVSMYVLTHPEWMARFLRQKLMKNTDVLILKHLSASRSNMTFALGCGVYLSDLTLKQHNSWSIESPSLLSNQRTTCLSDHSQRSLKVNSFRVVLRSFNGSIKIQFPCFLYSMKSRRSSFNGASFQGGSETWLEEGNLLKVFRQTLIRGTSTRSYIYRARSRLRACLLFINLTNCINSKTLYWCSFGRYKGSFKFHMKTYKSWWLLSVEQCCFIYLKMIALNKGKVRLIMLIPLKDQASRLSFSVRRGPSCVIFNT